MQNYDLFSSFCDYCFQIGKKRLTRKARVTVQWVKLNRMLNLKFDFIFHKGYVTIQVLDQSFYTCLILLVLCISKG